MTNIDILIFCMLIWGCWMGYRNGLIVEIFLCISLPTTILISIKLQILMLQTISLIHFFNHRFFGFLFSFMLFFISIVAVFFLGNILRKFLGVFWGRYIDQILGLFLGMLRWLVMIAGGIYAIQHFHTSFIETYIQHTLLASPIQKLIHYIAWVITNFQP